MLSISFLKKKSRKKSPPPSSKNHAAFRLLRDMGYSVRNIRGSLPKLTGISQPEAARIAGIPRGVVSQVITGYRHKRSYQEAVAKVYQIPVSELFAED